MATLKLELDAVALALTRLPAGPFREDCCDKHRAEVNDARDDGLACYGLYAGDRKVQLDPRALATILNAVPALLALANAALPDWREGPPPDRGEFWIVLWHQVTSTWSVELVSITNSAIPGLLLLSVGDEGSFRYNESIRFRISHHAPMVVPAAPLPLDGRGAPPAPEAK